MKHFLYILLPIFFFVSIDKETVAQNINADTKLIITGGSGFVTKEFGLTFLLNENDISFAINDMETTPEDLYWQHFEQTDTIGRYYRKGNSDHYIICLIDPADLNDPSFEKYIIIEIDAKGELLKRENFPSHGWRCLYENAYSGFSKYGDFFGFEVCIGGPGWSYTDLYLFKEIIPKDSINPIPVDGWINPGCGVVDFYREFNVSSMEIKENEVIIHYLKDKEKHKFDKNGKFLSAKVLEKDRKITVRYLYNNGKWKVKNKRQWKKLDCI